MSHKTRTGVAFRRVDGQARPRAQQAKALGFNEINKDAQP